MSEHDEPKTALTRLLSEHGRAHPIAEIGGFKIRCTCGLILREVEDGMLTVPLSGEDRAAHAAHLADVLLTEGYTTRPAPEATETVEHEIQEVRSYEGGLIFVKCSCLTGSLPIASEWIKHHWDGAPEEGVDAIKTAIARQKSTAVDRAADEHEEGGQ